ncbi:hypothetical protein BJM51_13535 [Listeria monocytogenes]|uniref:TIGR04197 family type VII secretion effector n=1 Tax=Listeria monocytogenes TaxID=1639 RepID=A0A457BTD6_LISMN|nr:hypothetical protein [Listeria monocytogenes]EAC2499493.1 hypothetical protein [Listeria monocytogenes]EAC4202700.1 hypothetical protein [Listeria monocytogenes]EAC5220977.1 hypothetical protein [Listeria monocytogenes]EAC5533593.1 hypothetical protein [Listeria monocytogenes]EAC6410281.1 hypothetical protein [Listeria monocytogenes]
MMKVASSTSAAQSAVSGVKSVSVNRGEQVSLEKSNISSMESGKKINNQLLKDLVDLVDCVQNQSQKFPKIAEMMSIQDKQIKF